MFLEMDVGNKIFGVWVVYLIWFKFLNVKLVIEDIEFRKFKLGEFIELEVGGFD